MTINNITTDSQVFCPDIFYIILDGYPNSSVLKEFCGFDNQPFIDYLTKKGFYVATKSCSNYPSTFLSLASSLNMQYVNNFTDMIGKKSIDRSAPYKMIEDNVVANFLKLQGYKFINISSGFKRGPTGYMRYADFNFYQAGLKEFIKLLISRTVWNPFMKYFAEDDKIIRLLYFISILPKLDKIKSPKFVLAHIITQSFPQGQGLIRKIMKGEISSMAEKKLIAAKYITFINDNLKKIVDHLLSQSKNPPIIILQSDHGSRVMNFDHPGKLQKEGLTDGMLRECMGIFNAYYLPQKDNNLLYSSITPVNTFRLIFNLYFNANYEILNDHCYYSTKIEPYNFFDVTDRLKFN